MILFTNGHVEARRVDEPSELIRTAEVVLQKEVGVKLRVSSECIYVLNTNYIEGIYLKKERGQKKILL